MFVSELISAFNNNPPRIIAPSAAHDIFMKISLIRLKNCDQVFNFSNHRRIGNGSLLFIRHHFSSFFTIDSSLVNRLDRDVIASSVLLSTNLLSISKSA